MGHVGASKFTYDNFAFGDASLTWDHPAGGLACTMEDLQSRDPVPGGEPPMADVLAWVREGHARLREHVASLDDSDLLTPRRRPEGGTRETRWIIGVLIGHDLYHAGEINHIRALRQRNDGWAWETV